MTEKTIAEKISDFISYKHSLGYVYDTQERYLRHYREHMDQFYPELLLPDKESTDSFLNIYQGQTGGLYNAIAPLREFSRYLFQIGYKDAYIIPPKQLPRQHPEPPYFFSEEEIAVFFHICDDYFQRNPWPLGRSLVLPAEFRVLYSCGLRPKEARLLPAKNVHLSEKYFDVVQSKGPKSRRVYISNDLASYLTGYEERIHSLYPARVYFFPANPEEAYSVSFMHYNFRLIWNQAFPAWEGKMPRIYDFRHHFAWSNINRWVREGTDVNAMLPYLMRYMGHNCIKHTLYYFRFVPDFYQDYKNISSRLNDRIPEVMANE